MSGSETTASIEKLIFKKHGYCFLRNFHQFCIEIIGHSELDEIGSSGILLFSKSYLAGLT